MALCRSGRYNCSSKNIPNIQDITTSADVNVKITQHHIVGTEVNFYTGFYDRLERKDYYQSSKYKC